jgi:hypothetical protein
MESLNNIHKRTPRSTLKMGRHRKASILIQVVLKAPPPIFRVPAYPVNSQSYILLVTSFEHLARVLTNVYSADDAFRLVLMSRGPCVSFFFSCGGSGSVRGAVHITEFHVVRLGLCGPGSSSLAGNPLLAFATEVPISVHAVRSSPALNNALELQSALGVWVNAGALERS